MNHVEEYGAEGDLVRRIPVGFDSAAEAKRIARGLIDGVYPDGSRKASFGVRVCNEHGKIVWDQDHARRYLKLEAKECV